MVIKGEKKRKKKKKKKVEKSINLTTSRRRKEGGKTRVNKVNGIVTKTLLKLERKLFTFKEGRKSWAI